MLLIFRKFILVFVFKETRVGNKYGYGEGGNFVRREVLRFVVISFLWNYM